MTTPIPLEVIGGAHQHLSDSDLTDFVDRNLAPLPLDGKDVVLVVPDGTRSMPLPLVMGAVHRALIGRAAKLTAVIALGTHSYMEPHEIERMFGAEVIRTMQQGKPRIDLKLGGANVFIIEVVPDGKTNPPPRSPYQGLDHFGLSVTGIDALAAELKGKGAEFTMEPTTIRPGTRICFLRGPEGVSIELLERTPA